MSTYNISGFSSQGNSSNTQNIYMNGLYMDSFKFRRYEKSINAGSTGLYMVCNSCDGEDVSRKLFAQMKAEVMLDDDMSADEIFSLAMMVVSDFDMRCSGAGRSVLDISIVAVSGMDVRAVSMGNTEVYVKAGGALRPLCMANPMLALGHGNVYRLEVLPVEWRLSEGDSVLACTGELSKIVHFRQLEECMSSNSAGCMKAIDNCLSSVKSKSSVSMVCIGAGSSDLIIEDSDNDIVSARNHHTGKKNMLIVAIIAAVVAVCLLVAGIYIFWQIDKTDSNMIEEIDISTGMTKEEMDVLKNTRNFASLKNYHLDTVKPVYEKNKVTVENIEVAFKQGFYNSVKDDESYKTVKENIDIFNPAFEEYMEIVSDIDSLENDEEGKKRLDEVAEIVYFSYDNMIRAYTTMDNLRETREETKKNESKSKKTSAPKKSEKKSTSAPKKPSGNTKTETKPEPELKTEPKSEPKPAFSNGGGNTATFSGNNAEWN